MSKSYLKTWLEKDSILENLDEYDDDALIEILNMIDTENFSDMIYISDFYLGGSSLTEKEEGAAQLRRDMFLKKISQIKNWKVYFDRDCPEDFVRVFFDIARFNLVDTELVLYYLSCYKLPLDIFEKHFSKIYQYVFDPTVSQTSNTSMDGNKFSVGELRKDSSYSDLELEDYRKRQFLRKKSVVYTGVFAAYTTEELVQIFDYLMDKSSILEKQETYFLDNPYIDVLLILIKYIKESNQNINLPESRLERLYELVKKS